MRRMRIYPGFTLVEAVAVIAITGVIAAVVAVFVLRPMEAYLGSARRAEMSDTADTAVRRVARDLRLALPNSVRVSSDGRSLEFLSTSAGGRYRAVPDADGGGDILDFTSSDDSFDVLGPALQMSTTTNVNQNKIVVYNLGIPGADAYAQDNLRTYVGAAGATTIIRFSPGIAFPLDSPARRFYVVDTPVSYVCDPAARLLWRYWGYPISLAQPAAARPPAAQRALLADHIDCSFDYVPAVTERMGLVTVHLRLAQEGETVNLYHEVHLTNAP